MTIALVAALSIGPAFTVLVITTFVVAAEMLERLTVSRGRAAIGDLLNYLPQTACDRRGASIVQVPCRPARGASVASPRLHHAHDRFAGDALEQKVDSMRHGVHRDDMRVQGQEGLSDPLEPPVRDVVYAQHTGFRASRLGRGLPKISDPAGEEKR